MAALGSGSHGGVSVAVVLTARHQDGDSVEDGMVSRKVIGSSSGGVGHSSDRGKAAFSHWTHGSTGTVWTVVLRKRVGTNDFGKAVTCSKDTRGQGRDGWPKDCIRVCIHTQGYAAH